jgi:DNA repair protein RadC
MVLYKSKLDRYELRKVAEDFPRAKITGSKDSETYIRQFYFDDLEVYESFFILLLNRSNNTIGYAKISQGGVSGTVVDVKIIAKYAVESLAAAVILAHNHPSGNLTPSDADIQITAKTKNALQTLDIQCLDHIILTAENYFSFADNGVM